jgi:hypothetical protein
MTNLRSFENFASFTGRIFLFGLLDFSPKLSSPKHLSDFRDFSDFRTPRKKLSLPRYA